MQTKTYFYITDFIRARLRHVCSMLLIATFMLAQNTFAQAELSLNAVVVNEETLKNKDEIIFPVSEVEIGPGGNIKLERKYRTKKESLYEWHAHLLWESRYVTEGRDNLSANSLVSASTEFSIDEFSVVPWVADGAAVDYSEFNLNIVYGSRLSESLILYTGYNYVHGRFKGENDTDNEISLDLAYKWVKHVNALASIYYSFDANGSFMEVALKYNNAINKTVHYSVQGVLGVNAEYVPDGHNGFNHFQLRANASYHPGRQIELYAYSGYNLAINRDVINYADDESLSDFLWSGIGLTYLF